jgi:hypothetical protein
VTPSWKTPCRAGFAALLLFTPSCKKEPSRITQTLSGEEWLAPMNDAKGTCADVHDVRVCWDGAAASHAPAAPPFPGATSLSHRCFGSDANRRCVRRDRDAPRFTCRGERCEQLHPRLPDDGEWECADLGGVVLCKGGDRPAGIPPGGSDPAFFCGAGGASSERLCIDYSPDLPHEEGRFRCHFEAKEGVVRVCERAADVHGVADGCDAQRPCVGGLACTRGRCLPPPPPPVCWLDSDCASGACLFGACAGSTP